MRSTYDIALRNMVTCRTVRTCRELYARATHSPTKQGFGLRCLQHTGRAIQKTGTMHVEWLYSRNAEFRALDYGDRQPLSVHRLGRTNVSANAGVGIPRT